MNRTLSSGLRVKGGNVLFSVPRIYPRRIALAVMFLMTARTFYFFPGMSVPSEAWNLLSAGFLAFVYLGWKIKVKGRFESFEFYVLILMVLMPLWAGLMAMYVFGQPMIFGVLSQRTMVLGTGALALLLFYKAGWIDSNACRQAFLIPAWATLVLYSAYQVYLQTGFSLNAPKARFVYAFVEIGFYYYAITGFNRKSKAHFLLALPFFVYIISTGQRALLLTTIGTYGLYVLVRGSFSRLIVFIPASLCGFAALVAAFYLVNPDYVGDLVSRTGDALTVVTTGQATADASASIRIVETAVAIPYIEASPWFGNGDISNQWHGGYFQVLHAYFYPSDVGLFGVAYMYGIIGGLIFALQFWWAWKYAKRAADGVRTAPMTDAVIAFLIAYAVLSLEAGTFVGQFQTGMLAIMYLFIAADEKMKMRPTAAGFPRPLHAGAALRGLQNR